MPTAASVRVLGRAALPLACLWMLAGCAATDVAAWQKKHLAREDMQLDRAPLIRQFAQQAAEAREAASGGRGVGGGGCGCN